MSLPHPMSLPLTPGVAYEILVATTSQGTEVYVRRLPPPEPIEEGEDVDDEISYFEEDE